MGEPFADRRVRFLSEFESLHHVDPSAHATVLAYFVEHGADRCAIDAFIMGDAEVAVLVEPERRGIHVGIESFLQCLDRLSNATSSVLGCRCVR